MMNDRKIKTIDLFAGCGGLTDGFKQSDHYETIAAVEWEKAPCKNLGIRLETKWNYKDAEKRVLRFDIQRTDELFQGWTDDEEYGSADGLDCLVNESDGIDMIIGGPPCQAYSIAGRVRDNNGMRDDYRNFLFESYLKVVDKYKPKIFVFENVPGMLSAKPGEVHITELVQKGFADIGYTLLPDLKNAVIDFTNYGVPQNRKRVIIIGIKTEFFGLETASDMLTDFYENLLPKYKVKTKTTVKEAIGDLPKLFPLQEESKHEGKRISHSLPNPFVPNHVARWQSKRDIGVFELLTNDIATGECEYTSIDSLKNLYTTITGRQSNVHKYYVLRWNSQSNLIPAHLYKDGLRHIHPDEKQCRTITVREAARLQTFSDDYIFYGSNMELYKMIGNAVPPLFAKCLANAVNDLIEKYDKNN